MVSIIILNIFFQVPKQGPESVSGRGGPGGVYAMWGSLGPGNW